MVLQYVQDRKEAHGCDWNIVWPTLPPDIKSFWALKMGIDMYEVENIHTILIAQKIARTQYRS